MKKPLKNSQLNSDIGYLVNILIRFIIIYFDNLGIKDRHCTIDNVTSPSHL